MLTFTCFTISDAGVEGFLYTLAIGNVQISPEPLMIIVFSRISNGYNLVLPVNDDNNF